MNLTPFDDIVSQIRNEYDYQNAKFKGNAEKPLEVWLLIAAEYMKAATASYAFGSQETARTQLLKAVACSVRGLQTEKVVYTDEN
jgi:hypothetical protein